MNANTQSPHQSMIGAIVGDSDTIAAIAGSVAGAYWGIPDDIRSETLARLDEFQRETLKDFESRFGK